MALDGLTTIPIDWNANGGTVRDALIEANPATNSTNIAVSLVIAGGCAMEPSRSPAICPQNKWIRADGI